MVKHGIFSWGDDAPRLINFWCCRIFYRLSIEFYIVFQRRLCCSDVSTVRFLARTDVFCCFFNKRIVVWGIPAARISSHSENHNGLQSTFQWPSRPTFFHGTEFGGLPPSYTSVPIGPCCVCESLTLFPISGGARLFALYIGSRRGVLWFLNGSMYTFSSVFVF